MKENQRMLTPRLGLDFGKVIMGALQDGKADTSFLGSTLEEAMNSPATPGAIRAVRQLVDEFAGEVWIVSKCGPSVERKTRAWLVHHGFDRQTGWKPENVRFCQQRPEKAPICAELGITHFVDDRLDVLTPMLGVVPNLFLFGEQPRGQRVPEEVIEVPDWEFAVEEITRSLTRRTVTVSPPI